MSESNAAEVARLERNLALTTFLLESAADAALSAHAECESLTYELVRVRAELAELVAVDEALREF